MPEQSDLSRIRAAARGEPGAFDHLVEGYADRLRWLIRLRLDPVLRARVSVDDVLQESMIVASQEVCRIVVENEPAFWSWLCRVVEQRLIDARRRHLQAGKRDVRREWRPNDQGGGGGHNRHGSMLANLLVDRGPTPSEPFRSAEDRAVLEQALRDLPESFREVITLRLVEGLPVADTARIMERSPGAVRVLLTKAVRRLGEKLPDGGADA